MDHIYALSSKVSHADGQRVIVVDDDASVLSFLADAIGAEGMSVTAVSSVADAYAAMGALPAPVALITDVDLGPGPDGLAVARHARNRWPDLPIVMISGHHGGDLPPDLTAHTRFLAKPLRLSTLRNVLAQAITAVRGIA